ncbi:MAG: TraR/DksA family transcriptional regulator [Puniceicoccales bacterium]|jgi:RNA polymerase-binding transcription factor DksA|nr:TraR/DksA family transcriptional regulator [Puniceicoccales bacterium]
MNRIGDVNSSTHILLNALKSRKKRGENASETDTPYFSMDDVRQVLLARENEQREQENRIKIQNKQKLIEKVLHENKNTVVAAAGIADILGFDPIRKTSTFTLEKEKVPDKYRQYYTKLLKLQEAFEKNLSFVPSEIEFAWSLLKKEIDPGKEVYDALNRIRNGTYGICEITGEPIAEERLEAVPFARYSIKGQQMFERQMILKKEKQTSVLFGDETEDVFGEGYEEEE